MNAQMHLQEASRVLREVESHPAPWTVSEAAQIATAHATAALALSLQPREQIVIDDPSQVGPADREFLIVMRRAMLLVLGFIEKRCGVSAR